MKAKDIVLEHRKVYARVALVMVSCVSLTCAVGALLGVRNQCYGVSLNTVIPRVAVAAILFVFACLLGAAFFRRVRQVAFLAAVSTLLLWGGIEIWFGADDYAFYREVQAGSLEYHSRPRWRPFSSYGLVYSEDQFSAHD
jgi:hypothetical protein